MSDNARHGLWLIAGGYLAYNGIGLFRDALREKPDNYILFSVVGVLFVLFGIFMVIQAIKGLRKKDENSDSQSNEETPKLPEEEAETLNEDSKVQEIDEKENMDGE